MNRLCKFNVLLDLESTEPSIRILFYGETQKKPATLAVMDNYNFYDGQTVGHADSMTDPAQRAESVNIFALRILK